MVNLTSERVLLLTTSVVIMVSAAVNGGVIPNTIDNVRTLQHLSATQLAEELSGQFEGDIVLNDAQKTALRKRTGVFLPSLIWPNGVVHYEIVAADFDSAQLNAIISAMNDIQQATCVRFVPRTVTCTDYIRITGTEPGCFSYVGRQSGPQQLNLQAAAPGTGCFRHGTIMHELIHALGFYHMQSASNRDEHITIVWENVLPGAEFNFQVYGTDHVTDYGRQYDYSSIMHYSAWAFTTNGQATIVPRVPTVVIGQREWMSSDDVWRIWNMYKCS